MTVGTEQRRRTGLGSPSACALLAACVGFFIVSVDATIVNVALPAIARHLHAGISGLQWVVDGYTLTFACLLLSGGALGDRFGPGRVFVVGVTLFAVASAGCGAAPDSAFLVAARLVQGVGAALLMPTSLAMIRHAFDRDDARARAVAVWAAAGGAAVAAGPVIGGALIAIADWRAIFFVNLAVAPVAGVFAFRAKAGPGRSDRASLDVPGQAASVVALSALVYGLVAAGQSGWTSAVVVGCAAVTVAAAGMFLLIESRAKSPMLPLRFFRSPTFFACTGVGLILNLAFYGMVFVLLTRTLSLRRVRFSNAAGGRLVGDLYLPAGAAGELAALVVAGSWTTVKEQVAGLYAQRGTRPEAPRLTRLIAADLRADGILVNEVFPGWADTDMGRGGHPVPEGRRVWCGPRRFPTTGLPAGSSETVTGSRGNNLIGRAEGRP